MSVADKTADKLAVIKEIFSILAAICVGIWAVYGSWLKNEEHIADLQVLELQQKTSLNSYLLSDMSIEQLHKDESGTVLSVLVQLENKGNKAVNVVLDARSILVSKIEFENNRAVYRKPVYFGDSRYLGFTKYVGPYIGVSPNEKYKISFISKVGKSGVYLVRFLSEMDSNSVRDSEKTDFGDLPWMNYSTGIDRIIYVN